MKLPSLKQISDLIEKNILIVIAIVVLLIIIISIVLSRVETFSTRMMYLYNPTPRNQSKDIRGDVKIKKEKVGKWYESSLEKNYLDTERVRKTTLQ